MKIIKNSRPIYAVVSYKCQLGLGSSRFEHIHWHLWKINEYSFATSTNKFMTVENFRVSPLKTDPNRSISASPTHTHNGGKTIIKRRRLSAEAILRPPRRWTIRRSVQIASRSIRERVGKKREGKIPRRFWFSMPMDWFFCTLFFGKLKCAYAASHLKCSFRSDFRYSLFGKKEVWRCEMECSR